MVTAKALPFFFFQIKVKSFCTAKYGSLEGTFPRKEIETSKLEWKSKQQISRLNDLLYSLNDIISR